MYDINNDRMTWDHSIINSSNNDKLMLIYRIFWKAHLFVDQSRSAYRTVRGNRHTYPALCTFLRVDRVLGKSLKHRKNMNNPLLRNIIIINKLGVNRLGDLTFSTKLSAPAGCACAGAICASTAVHADSSTSSTSTCCIKFKIYHNTQ